MRVVWKSACVPAFQSKEFQSLLDVVLEDVTINRSASTTSKIVAWRFSPVSLEKGGAVLRPQNRQTAV